MTLEELGYTSTFVNFRIEQKLDGFEIGRVVAEHKERYVVRTQNVEVDAEVTGNLRFTAKSREDFPAVGDWVALSVYDSGFAVIHQIFPRFSIIKRQAVGQYGAIQIIAANIDFAFIIQSVNRDFSINRLERYLTICFSSKVSPVIILSKIDLITSDELSLLTQNIQSRIKNIPIIGISNETLAGYDSLKAMIEKGKTYCLLGSSGVGKSSLLNKLAGKSLMKTVAISAGTNRGRHATSHRELIVLENGGIIVDNPGMREVGIADSTDGLEITFDEIALLSKACRFNNCTHTSEIGCAVLDAVEKGDIEKASYENYLKMEREKAHFESTIEERRKKDKDLGKLIRNYKKDMSKNGG